MNANDTGVQLQLPAFSSVIYESSKVPRTARRTKITDQLLSSALSQKKTPLSHGNVAIVSPLSHLCLTFISLTPQLLLNVSSPSFRRIIRIIFLLAMTGNWVITALVAILLTSVADRTMKRTNEDSGPLLVHIPRIIANNEFSKLPAANRPYQINSFEAQRQYALMYDTGRKPPNMNARYEQRPAKANESNSKPQSSATAASQYLSLGEKLRMKEDGPGSAWKDPQTLADLYETIFQRFTTRLHEECDRLTCSVCDRDFARQALKSIDISSNSKILKGNKTTSSTSNARDSVSFSVDKAYLNFALRDASQAQTLGR